MIDDVITREEHKEFAKRMEEENERQNTRIGLLEDTTQQIHDLAASIKVMVVNMEHMLKEQKKQGERLEKLEQEPAEAHRQIKMSVVTSLVGAMVGAVVTAIIAIL